MTSNQKRALAALVKTRSIREAAAQAGIDERSIRRYLKDPDFLQEYRQIQAEILTDARESAQGSIAPALETLQEICTDTEARNSDRITAAKTLLEWACRLTELTDLEERITALETHVKGGIA